MGNRTITTVAGVHGQRMVPEYLINFLESIYPYKRPVNYGKRLLREDLLLRAMKLYKLAGKKPKAVFGRRMIPNYLAKFLEDNHFAEIDDTDMGYIKELNSIAYPYGNILKIGGMSYKCNNLVSISNTTITQVNYIANNYIFPQSLQAGNYTLSCNFSGTSSSAQLTIYDENNNVVGDQVFTVSANTSVTITTSGKGYKMDLYTNAIGDYSNFTLNLGSTALPYQPYFEGIRDSAVTSIVSKDSNNTTIDTFNVPAEIQALEGYGWGVNDTCYNYHDYETKKLYQVCARVDLGSLNYGTGAYGFYSNGLQNLAKKNGYTTIGKILCSIYKSETMSNVIANTGDMQIALGNYNASDKPNLFINNSNYNDAGAFKTAMSGVYLYFELEVPVETDISSYITTNEIEIVSGGTLTFTNTYEQAVPSEITYIVRF